MLLFLAAMAAFLLLGRIVRDFLHQSAIDRFSLQLTEALETIANALRSGASFYQALEMASEFSQCPFKPEIEGVLAQYRLGVPIEESMDGVCKRIPIPEMRQLTAALHIAQTSGGSLATLLGNLAGTLREQLSLKQRIRSLSAQGQLQAVILVALPYLLLLVYRWIEPDILHGFLQGSWADPVLATVITAQCIAITIMQKMVNIQP